ncbi:mitochondrial fission regulator 2 [Astyanax mexicanus]|uniref:Mitochondrial fission regulator n=1 Tax=Astyanax mexicanus TaxID=7994 RepID=A0A8T2LEB1_ASTMX|nr:mitochondrial fission regulator 2 [Astyanax mexicanus]
MLVQMSLLEDIVDLLRYVFEYFGVPTDMLTPVWETTLCGQYRSIVRMIGTNLPLAPYPRVHFQIPLQTFRRHGHINVSVDAPGIPSLADVLYVAEDEGDRYTKFRSAVPLSKYEWPQRKERPAEAAQSLPNASLRRAPAQSAQPEALQKISALEAELNKLRAQIAMIVAVPTADSILLSAPATPCSTPLPAPVLTSTPLCAPPPPPPPLPPPPPPPPGVASSPHVSVSEVIRQRQAAKKDKAGPSECTTSSSVPSMLDVLKDINKVKLRSVERSPGGTPVRKRRSKGGPASLSDPAALIAEALKRKFAHKLRENSFDKENHSAELSPFSSPDTPRVSHPIRRGQGRIHL